MADLDRARSFIERYVIARAGHFDKANEESDAWECILRARTVYNQIEGVAKPCDRADANMPQTSGM